MKKLLAAALAVSGMAFAAPAFAQHLDASLGYTSVDAGEPSVGAITGRVSYGFTPIFGVEGEASFGVKDDTISVAGTNVNVELKHDVAAYVTAGVPLGENNTIFARVGYGSTDIEGSAGGVTVGDTDENWRYGVGAQFLIDGMNGFRVDYTKINIDNSIQDANTWSISYVRRFR